MVARNKRYARASSKQTSCFLRQFSRCTKKHWRTTRWWVWVGGKTVAVQICWRTGRQLRWSMTNCRVWRDHGIWCCAYGGSPGSQPEVQKGQEEIPKYDICILSYGMILSYTRSNLCMPPADSAWAIHVRRISGISTRWMESGFWYFAMDVMGICWHLIQRRSCEIIFDTQGYGSLGLLLQAAILSHCLIAPLKNKTLLDVSFNLHINCRFLAHYWLNSN